MIDDLTFDASMVGIWTDEVHYEATAERIAGYSKATNDPIAAHLSGDLAGPVFAVVPVTASIMTPALQAIPKALHNQAVYNSHEFQFHRPICAGDKLVARAMLLGWEGTLNGTRGSLFIETHTDGGELVNEQRGTFFVRGFDAGERIGEVHPALTVDRTVRTQTPVAEVLQHVDHDQTYRYSPAAGDPMRIHLDPEIAKAAGLPGIIVHGMCTQAFASWAVLTEVGDSNVSRLKRFAARFAWPVLPGQDLVTRIWPAGRSNGAAAYVFETTVSGVTVIKNGYAEIAD